MSLALAITNNETNTYGFSPKAFKQIASKGIMASKVSKMSVKNGTVSWSMNTDKDGNITAVFPWGTPPDIVARGQADLLHINKTNAVKNRLRAKLAAKKN